jgi:hypothetical protein
MSAAIDKASRNLERSLVRVAESARELADNAYPLSTEEGRGMRVGPGDFDALRLALKDWRDATEAFLKAAADEGKADR